MYTTSSGVGHNLFGDQLPPGTGSIFSDDYNHAPTTASQFELKDFEYALDAAYGPRPEQAILRQRARDAATVLCQKFGHLMPPGQLRLLEDGVAERIFVVGPTEHGMEEALAYWIGDRPSAEWASQQAKYMAAGSSLTCGLQIPSANVVLLQSCDALWASVSEPERAALIRLSEERDYSSRVNEQAAKMRFTMESALGAVDEEVVHMFQPRHLPIAVKEATAKFLAAHVRQMLPPQEDGYQAFTDRYDQRCVDVCRHIESDVSRIPGYPTDPIAQLAFGTLPQPQAAILTGLIERSAQTTLQGYPSISE